jgi:hypothetical protein
MGWTDLDPQDVPTRDELLANVQKYGEAEVLRYEPQQMLDYLSDEGLADWVSVEDDDSEGAV